MNDAGIAALALRVSGLDEIVEKVTSGGFALSSGIVEQVLPDGAILRVAVCRGPDNVKVILVQPPAGRKSLARPVGRGGPIASIGFRSGIAVMGHDANGAPGPDRPPALADRTLPHPAVLSRRGATRL